MRDRDGVAVWQPFPRAFPPKTSGRSLGSGLFSARPVATATLSPRRRARGVRDTARRCCRRTRDDGPRPSPRLSAADPLVAPSKRPFSGFLPTRRKGSLTLPHQAGAYVEASPPHLPGPPMDRRPDAVLLLRSHAGRGEQTEHGRGSAPRRRSCRHRLGGAHALVRRRALVSLAIRLRSTSLSSASADATAPPRRRLHGLSTTGRPGPTGAG